MTDLEAQVKREAAELAAAPALPSADLQLRCHFCGQLTDDPDLVFGPQHPATGKPAGDSRVRGACCRAKQ